MYRARDARRASTRNGAILFGAPGEPAAAAGPRRRWTSSAAGGVIAYPDGLVLRARLPHRRQGGDGAHPPHPQRGRAPPPHARVPRPVGGGAVRQGGQPAVPTDHAPTRRAATPSSCAPRATCRAGCCTRATRSACASRTTRCRCALLDALGEPLLSSTLILPAHGQPLNDADGDPPPPRAPARPRDRRGPLQRRGDHGDRPVGRRAAAACARARATSARSVS